MTTNPNRVQAGVPAGGQFAPGTKAEAEQQLTAVDKDREERRAALRSIGAEASDAYLQARDQLNRVSCAEIALVLEEHGVAGARYVELVPNEDLDEYASCPHTLGRVVDADGNDVMEAALADGTISEGASRRLRDEIDVDVRTLDVDFGEPIVVEKPMPQLNTRYDSILIDLQAASAQRIDGGWLVDPEDAYGADGFMPKDAEPPF